MTCDTRPFGRMVAETVIALFGAPGAGAAPEAADGVLNAPAAAIARSVASTCARRCGSSRTCRASRACSGVSVVEGLGPTAAPED